MDKELDLSSALLDEKGRLLQAGRSHRGLPAFLCGSLPFLTRELRYCAADRYLFGDENRFVAISAVDAGCFGELFAALYTKGENGYTERFFRKLLPLGLGSFDMPDTPDFGDVIIRTRGASLDLCKSPDSRLVRCRVEGFDDVRSLYVNVTLEQPGGDSLYIASPLECKGGFRAAHTLFGMRARGKIVCGGEDYELDGHSGFGCLDWERGVFPHPLCSSRLCGDGEYEGERVGFSFGCGLCGESACENIICVSGEGFNPGEAQISADKRDYMRPWRLHSADKRSELSFAPVSVHVHALKLLKLLRVERVFAFGKYSGSLRLGNGRTLALDSFPGFGELTTRY